MNLLNTITPRADQQNADDFLAGPRTIRITGVSAGTEEQPVNISFEGDGGRPWKPSKGMRRVLVALYGAESSAMIGKRVTLFNDPTVTFGADTTGGIRISHASDIAAPVTLALSVKRGKRKPYTVQPLPPEAQPRDRATLEAIGNTKAKEGTDALKAWWASLLPKEQQSIKDLTAGWKETAAATSAA